MKQVKKNNKGKKIYLAGSMEFASDKGEGWRTEVQKKLEADGFEVYNPCDNESGVLKSHGIGSTEEFHALKMTDYNRFKNCMKDVIRCDLTEIANSDYVLLYIDPVLCNKASGTIGEITASFHYLKVPVYAIVEESLAVKDISGWLLACTEGTFTTFDAAISAIDKSRE